MENPSATPRSKRSLILLIAGAMALLLLLLYLLAVLWSSEPENIDIGAIEADANQGGRMVTGYTTVETVARVADTLLEKRGGFLSNDIMPPGVWMDNMPAWEYGVLVQVRDMAKSLRNDMSRSQSQSLEDTDLKEAEPLFNIDRRSWFLPEAEDEYRKGIARLRSYRDRLGAGKSERTRFYARADNLRDWLAVVDKRLGSLSQRLSASVADEEADLIQTRTDNEGIGTEQKRLSKVRTPWLEIDDVFWEARGTAWALIQLLKAVQNDFGPVLEDKNALVSLRQIIRELEATQEFVWSPMVLNGSGFGVMANHSLVMGSYISRANAGLIDLRDLLKQG